MEVATADGVVFVKDYRIVRHGVDFWLEHLLQVQPALDEFIFQ